MAEIALPTNEWVLLPITKAAVIRHRSGKGLVIYCQSPDEPADFLAFNDSTLGKVIGVDMIIDGEFIYAKSLNQPSVIVVSNRESSGFPDGVFSGERAINIQQYTESNKKLGSEWEASKTFPFSSKGDKSYSLIVVGSKSVDLKGRVLGATGAGVYGRHYKIQASDVTVDPESPEPWYNFRASFFGTQPESKLYSQSAITFNTPVVNLAVQANKVFADINAITNAQNQASGVIPKEFGSNHILEPFDYILLEIESFDASQIATSGLEIFEGKLDLPLNQ